MMPDIDTSTYPKANNTSPLKTFSDFATLQNTLNQNKLFQQQYNTNLAVSNIYKQAMNPDGTIDQAKLSALLASDPNASYGLPQAYQQSQEARARNIGIDTAQLENQRKHWEAVGSFISPLLSLGNKATSGDVAHQLAAATTAGLASPEEASKVWATLPRTPDGRIDETKIPSWSQQMMLNLMDRQSALNATNPAPTIVNTGQSQIPMRLPQIGAPSLAGPGIQNELPPTTQRYNPQTRQMEFVGPTGGGGQGGGNPSQGGGAPMGGGGGGMAAAPPLGAPEAASVDAHASAQQGTELQRRSDRVNDTKAILGNLEGELNTPGFNTGPGTKSMADWAKFMNTQFGMNIRVEGLAAREQFNKLAGMLAQSQFQALGGTGTDAKLDATTLTSPNSELSKLGNKGIIALLKGNEDAIAVKNRAWQAYKQQHGPESYGQFSTEFNKSYDPRVFQSQYLTPDDRKKMLSGMTKQEQKSFLNSYRTALNNGWVQLPGQ